MKRTLLMLIAMVASLAIPSFAQEVNMSRYITLTVKSGKDIGLNFKATQANTPVRIVSGGNTKNIIVNNTWYAGDNQYFTVTADGTTMTIYGDIVDFNCSYNKLTSLDVSKNPQLTTLNCGGNQLTSLDVSKNPQLTTLDCYGNQLTSLDMSNNTQLKSLYCNNNQLTSLDVSKSPQLTELYCYSNQLTSLDVSKSPQLTTLNCGGNQLTSLDVSKNPQLTYLYCDGNKFTTESMNELYCSLPDRQGREEGKIYPLYEKDDANHETIAAATSDIAKKKNWQVKYSNGTKVPSKGNYKCK